MNILTWQLAETEQSGEFLHYNFTVESINKVIWEPSQQKDPICTSDISSTTALSLFSWRILAKEKVNKLKTVRGASISTVLWKFKSPLWNPFVYLGMQGAGIVLCLQPLHIYKND